MPERITLGIDEVGRGPLAGPVVAACVYIPDPSMPWLADIRDSKKISAGKRQKLADLIRTHCIFAIATVSPERIDAINIHHASLEAMAQAVARCPLPARPDLMLFDGRHVPPGLSEYTARAVIGGDDLVPEIGCASIIAKVWRDAWMERTGNGFPAYQWHKNAGYGTRAHLDAIRDYGVTPHHRRSFAPVRIAIERLSQAA